ncbi:MAG: hypothetical protein CMK70_13555 [Pseudohongiella sp.]|nr:hypothetical protein [Pseudohongiella sp.]|tara:strand:- start:14379 stop:15011 length:633 start_codon:yes stop_codon:yes gene_type:complete
MHQKFEVKNLEVLRAQLGDSLVDKINASAVGKTVNKLQTYVSKEVRQRYNVKAGTFRRYAKKMKGVRRANEVSAVLLFRSRKLGYLNFGAKPRRVTLGRKTKKGQRWGRFRTGVTVQVMKADARKLIRSRPAFLATGQNGNQQVFYRDPRGKTTSGGKQRLIPMKGPSIPDMVVAAGDALGTPYDVFAAEEYDKEFDVALNYYMSKQGGA